MCRERVKEKRTRPEKGGNLSTLFLLRPGQPAFGQDPGDAVRMFGGRRDSAEGKLCLAVFEAGRQDVLRVRPGTGKPVSSIEKFTTISGKARPVLFFTMKCVRYVCVCVCVCCCTALCGCFSFNLWVPVQHGQESMAIGFILLATLKPHRPAGVRGPKFWLNL